MRWAAGGAAIVAMALLALAGLTATAVAETCDRTGTCGPDTRRYALAVRCNAAVVKDAETNDTLTVTAWNGEEFLGMMPWLGVICSRWYDPNRENAYFTVGDFNKRPTHFILETSGDDAFFADWIEISEITTDEYGGPKQETRIAQFGAPGGRGYCLSRDPNDHSGEWAAASDACDAAIELNLPDNAVYGATPTELGEWLIGLDCVHAALPQTLPWATMTIAVYDTAGKLIQQHSRPHNEADYRIQDKAAALAAALTCPVDQANWGDPYGQVHGLWKFVARDVGAIEISVGPLDENWWLETKPMHARFYIDQLVALRDYVDVAHWDMQEASGWCLSRYPENWEGLWQAFAQGGCYPGIRFDVKNKTWSPIQAK
jgi:hypothetical protein